MNNRQKLSCPPKISLINQPISPGNVLATTATKPEKMADFIKQVNEDCIELNIIIRKYNLHCDNPQSTDTEIKNSLQSIYELRKLIEDKYPAAFYGDCLDYREQIQDRLLQQLRKGFESIGIQSMLEHAIYGKEAFLSEHGNPLLAELIAQMPASKIAAMIAMLSAAEPNKLITLYEANEEGYATFQFFLTTHSISFLGGAHSKNFKVIHLKTKETSVLKIEYRMDMPKKLEAKLRAGSLHDVFTPIMVERQGTFINSEKKPITRTLLVTSYCVGGDLLQHASKQLSDTEKIRSALTIYTQMASVLIAMCEQNVVHTDMKNSNWMIDNKGALRISDTKGFDPIQNGVYTRNNTENLWYGAYEGLVHTQGYDAFEYNCQGTFPADTFHAYILGKNLYEYITGCKIEQLPLSTTVSNDHFILPIFRTDIGALLKQLIQQLTETEYTKRCSVASALTKLKSIQRVVEQKVLAEQLISVEQLTKKKNQCFTLLQRIVWEQKFGDSDTLMNDYVTTQKKAIEEAKTPEELNALQKQMETMVNNYTINAVHQKIYSYKQQYWPGMRSKAKNIELMMAKIAIAERGTILKDTGLIKSEAGINKLNVQKSLAAHRYFFWSADNVYLNKDGTINEKKAARSFKTLKEECNKFNKPY
jgi:serine/threonine protein kinase